MVGDKEFRPVYAATWDAGKRLEALDYLVFVMGDDRMMLGTEHPYPMGEEQMGSLVRNARHLNSHQKTRILGENASLFFNRAFDKRT